MIGRRLLLLGGVAALAGCTVGENVQWLPWTAPSPLPVTVPDDLTNRLARTDALAGHLLSHAADWKLSGRRVSTLKWFRKAITEHFQVVTSSDPARRQHATTALPSTPPPTQTTARATQAALTGELAALRALHRTSAQQAAGPAALLWASLGAFSATMATGLPAGVGTLGDDGTDGTPDLTGTGVDQVLLLGAQAVYGYEMALAAPNLAASDRALFQARFLQWQAFRPKVLSASPATELTAPAIGYDLRPARDRAAARQIAVQIETAALPMLGAWLAGTSSGPERRIGIDSLADSNAALVRFGGPALRWPGWPG
ncbi:MAG: DUF4439 domain-containing protein [Micropruina sp.]